MSELYPLPKHATLLIALTGRRNDDSEIYLGIGFMDGVAGQRGWRWILIIEGLPTFFLGISTWFLLADDPESAYYLTKVRFPLFLLVKEVSCVAAWTLASVAT